MGTFLQRSRRPTALQDYYFGSQEKESHGNALDRSVSPAAVDFYYPGLRMNSPFHPASFALQPTGSVQHEMIVAYLYQQQCSRCWISNMNSVEEGAFMRQSWASFVTSPVLLSQTALAEALVDLNAEVRCPLQLVYNLRTFA